jgi:hypothetical protein
MLAIAPGVVLAGIVGTAAGGEAAFLLGLTALSAWELLVGTVCFALSKGVLHHCDMAAIWKL